MKWCRFGFHKWGQWSEPERWVKKAIREDGETLYTVVVERQERLCSVCGKIQRREVG